MDAVAIFCYIIPCSFSMISSCRPAGCYSLRGGFFMWRLAVVLLRPLPAVQPLAIFLEGLHVSRPRCLVRNQQDGRRMFLLPHCPAFSAAAARRRACHASMLRRIFSFVASLCFVPVRMARM
jgi:hypothetical protein